MRPPRHLLAGAALLALAWPGAWIDARMFFAAWLAACWWGLGVVLGALANQWMHRLTGGRWGDALRPAAIVLARRLPWVLLSFLPLFAGLRLLYPWAADLSGAWAHDAARPAFRQAWLTPGFFVVRMLVYAAMWWVLSRHGADAALRKGRAAASLLLHAAVTSLAAVDLLMSLMPTWHSSGFGLRVLTSQLVGGSAFLVGLSASRLRALPRASPPLSRDLGNLLLMYLMSWAYLAFMEYLIIWAENLPREIAWYLPRVQTGWRWIGLALVVLHLALPLVALLFRALKDDPRRLAWIAFALLGAHALDVAWLVLPSVAPHSLHGWWLFPLVASGLGLCWFGSVPAALRHSDDAQETRHAHA
jgi:hypothetical protein